MARTIAAALPRVPAARASWWHWPHYSLPGTALALLFGCLSFTPSLVPRGWIVQGIVSGLSATVGYAVGVFLSWLAHALREWALPVAVVRRLWLVLAAVGVPLGAFTLWLGQNWQRQTRELTGVQLPGDYDWVRILLVTLLVFVVVVGVARGFRWLVRWVTVPLMRWVPRRVAGPLAFIVVVSTIVALNNSLVERGLVNIANSAFGTVNGTTSAGTYRPRSSARSGSPASLIPWTTLGRMGQEFVAHGPGVKGLTAFAGAPAREPVRIYAGLKSAPTIRQEAALAVRDLRRAGGFDRKVLVVATTTGTGFVDPAAIASLEYMYRGDTATVALQYSYLPSWISLLVDHQRAEEAGRELFNQVYDAWARLPTARRPKLLVTATSLGELGSEAAFSGLPDILNRTDGVVWVGAPQLSALHQRIVQERDPGSPEWLPVYQHGRTVRFVASPRDVWAPGPVWPRPRVVYLQYGSDAVVRWTPKLAFTKPGWLSEPRAPDVSPHMHWFPVVTFWQVTADLPSTYGVPAGHGHRYRELYADAWAAVAPPPGWTPHDTQRLRAQLKRDQARPPAGGLTASRTGPTR